LIGSKKDLIYYLMADKIALGIKRNRPRRFGDEIWKYQILLRKVEYYSNCRKSPIYKPILLLLRLRLHYMSIRLGFSIPINVCGSGLNIAHIGTIIISPNALIGVNCRIHAGVNIGANLGEPNSVPVIGNNVYIGPGAKIFGPIEIADNIAIGANAVVNKSFKEPGISIAGVPAKKINDMGSDGFIIKATELLKNGKYK
jgi:serine O-acetyltransferase